MTDINSMKMRALWSDLHEKYAVQLKADFSSQSPERWLSHFAPHHRIDVSQNGRDVTGKSGKGKTMRVYTGGWISSLLTGRIPAKLMAKILFKRLAKQNYSHSEVDLHGIQYHTGTEEQSQALVAFKRFNTMGEAYESAAVIYNMIARDGTWLICGLSTYDGLEQVASLGKSEAFWNPESA